MTLPTSCLPLLPAGYSAMAAWGFHDPAGFAYEFFRVYGPAAGGGDRGEFSQIDEGLSFWAVAIPTAAEAADVHLVGRWLNFAAAQKASGARLSFAKFSSALAMSDEIPRLLMANDIPTQAPPRS